MTPVSHPRPADSRPMQREIGWFGGRDQAASIVEGIQDRFLAGDGQAAGRADVPLDVINLRIVGSNVDHHPRGIAGMNLDAALNDPY